MNGRQCMRDDGTPKAAFVSFDEAHEAATRRPNYHAYRCDEHGWHVGSNHSFHARPLAPVQHAAR